jgi:site-specific DNA recombinase
MKRAIGIVRVSQVNGREGDRFVSPEDQRRQIESLCKRESLRLLNTFEELDMSGGAPLERRTELRRAVEAIEAGEADVIVCGYFDRLVRSLKVQGEVVERVEAAGGGVLLADFGKLTNGTAVQWFSGTLIGAASEYVRRSTAERLASAQQTAIEQGRWPVLLIPGLRRDEAGRIELDPGTGSAVSEAFRLRAGGATVAAVRSHLATHRIQRSYHGTTSLLGSRQAIGEIRFGKQVGSIPALIDRDTWDRVQRMAVPRGRKPKSDRLLARLGVLRCGSCDSRMVVGTSNHSTYYIYRCPPTGDCSRRQTISAEVVESEVVAWVQHHLADLIGTASGDSGVADAQIELERAQADVDAALRSFTSAGLAGEPAAIERLAELREARDRAKDRYADLIEAEQSLSQAVTVGSWDDLTPAGQRDLVRATIERVSVHPGRGAGRISIEAR